MRRALLTFCLGASMGTALAQVSVEELRWAQVDGERLAYSEQGRGEAVLFVHGGLQDLRLWSPHLPFFAQRYRVVAYSRRNHYPNATDPAGTPDGAADLHAADMIALVEQLKTGPVHVVAHSSGAHAALFFAALRPDLVRSLAVNEPPAMGLIAGTSHAADFAATLVPARNAFRRGDVDQGLRMFADAVGGPGTYVRRSAEAKKGMTENAAAHIADAVTARPRPTFTCEMAKAITAPTLVTRGTESPAVFHRIADELERCLPNVTAATIMGASHTAPAEEPAAYRAAVLNFLTGARETTR